MEADKYQKIKEIFQSVLEAPVDERHKLLDERCDADKAIRAEVERLLDSYESGFLEQPAAGELAASLASNGLRTGAAIGHYTILNKIGSGGMGEVYLAEDGKLGRKVAIKLLPETFTEDADRLRRFEQEARTASALNHPNILTVHEIGETGNSRYIATEYIDGETLRARLNRGKLDALDIAVQCASALAAAHVEGIIHRDIKPENIMLRRDNLVKVLDFGLAKLLRANGSTPVPGVVTTALPSLSEEGWPNAGMVPDGMAEGKAGHDALIEKHLKTAPGMIMGTVQYMSPEQTRGHANDARTDVWSLGCVLYEMISGKTPFTGERSADMIAAIVGMHPEALTKWAENVPQRLEEIVARTLAKDPGERYQSAEDLAADLKYIKRKFDLDAHPVSHDRLTAAALERRFPDTEDGEALVTGRTKISSAEYIATELRQHKYWTAGVLIVLLAAAAGSAFYWQNGWRGPSTSEDKSSYFLNFAEAKYQKVLENHGSVATISPDGRFIAYTGTIGGKQTLWLRERATNTNRQLHRGADLGYFRLRFSNDGRFIYYHRGDPVFRIPIDGGEETLVTRSGGSFTSSPNDDQIAFVRSLNAEQCGLFIANSDGTEEKMVANRNKPYCHSRLAWSRDGRRIAFFIGQGDTGGANTQLYTHEIASGAETPLSSEKWYHTYMPDWLPNDRGIIFSGRNPREVTNSLWQVNFPDGETRRITEGLERLTDLSITADGSTLLAVKTQLESSLAVSPANDPSNFTKIGTAFYGLTWLPEGKIVYANPTDNSLWKIDPDGTGQQQLTFDESGYLNPMASADGGYIYYTRDSGEARHIWRINPDGSGNVQMTTGSGEQKPNISRDGQWLYYQSSGKSSTTIWKIPANGGEPVQITNEASTNPSVSPDGRLLAYNYRTNLSGDIAIGVMDLESSRIVRRFEMPKGDFASARRIAWTNDSRALIIIKQDFDRVANLWQYPVDGSTPRLLTYYKDDEIFDFGFSPNNELLAVIRGDYRNEAVLITGYR